MSDRTTVSYTLPISCSLPASIFFPPYYPVHNPSGWIRPLDRGPALVVQHPWGRGSHWWFSTPGLVVFINPDLT